MAKTVRLSDFSTMKNESEGVWFEPKIRGFGTGIEVLVYGPNSDVAVSAREDFAKQLDSAKDVEDTIERKNIVDKATAEFVSKICGDVRGKDGTEVLNDDGNPVSKKDLLPWFLTAPLIVDSISDFFKAKESFLSKKKAN